MKLHVSEYAKALVGALVGGLSVLAGACGDGISTQEWLAAAVATLTGFGVVFGVPNRPPAGVPASPSLSEQDPVPPDL